MHSRSDMKSLIKQHFWSSYILRLPPVIFICKHWCKTVKVFKDLCEYTEYLQPNKVLTESLNWCALTCVKFFWSAHFAWLAFPLRNLYKQWFSPLCGSFDDTRSFVFLNLYTQYGKHCVQTSQLILKQFSICLFFFLWRRHVQTRMTFMPLTAVSVLCMLMGCHVRRETL